mmetsp:Transcript_7812/g.11275  ORF Transcript_7812/g.11275 Transcript_7812/m.11275 type:complete len:212 (-) Transcript_7812:89-724(-)|eukprot:scaffold258420_cov33-Tisochrysis_lutea.AAC.1
MSTTAHFHLWLRDEHHKKKTEYAAHHACLLGESYRSNEKVCRDETLLVAAGIAATTLVMNRRIHPPAREKSWAMPSIMGHDVHKAHSSRVRCSRTGEADDTVWLGPVMQKLHPSRHQSYVMSIRSCGRPHGIMGSLSSAFKAEPSTRCQPIVPTSSFASQRAWKLPVTLERAVLRDDNGARGGGVRSNASHLQLLNALRPVRWLSHHTLRG